MHDKVNYICGDYYFQVFCNKELYVEAYHMEKKSDWHKALEKCVKDYGVPDSMLYDGAQE